MPAHGVADDPIGPDPQGVGAPEPVGRARDLPGVIHAPVPAGEHVQGFAFRRFLGAQIPQMARRRAVSLPGDGRLVVALRKMPDLPLVEIAHIFLA